MQNVYETIITALCLLCDAIALPLFIKYRFGANKNKPKTAEEKRVLILPVHILVIRAVIFNVGFTAISIMQNYDMNDAFSLFLSGLIQLVLIMGWRSSFMRNAIRDDKLYTPEDAKLDQEA